MNRPSKVEALIQRIDSGDAEDSELVLVAYIRLLESYLQEHAETASVFREASTRGGHRRGSGFGY